jgi:hypothetical protein
MDGDCIATGNGRFSDDWVDEEYPFTDEELGALAMASDPNVPVPDDAVPISTYAGAFATALPGWYMPPAMARVSSRWRIALVLAIVIAFVAIDAWGMCSTYGWVTPA